MTKLNYFKYFKKIVQCLINLIGYYACASKTLARPVNNNNDLNIITNSMSNTASSISNNVFIPLSNSNNNTENLLPNASNNVITPCNF